MDTRNWFGQHAHTVRLFALIGGVVLAVIILVDIMTQKAKASATTTPTASGTTAPTSTLNPGETNISVFQDYSSHVGANANDYTGPSTVTSNRYAAPQASGSTTASATGDVTRPAAHQGGPVPVTTPHPSTLPSPHPTAHPTYTVRPGDSLWSIAAAELGSGFDWQELYNWNRSVVGSNPNLIYPGETLALN